MKDENKNQTKITSKDKELQKLIKQAKDNGYTIKNVGYDDFGRPIIFVK